MTMIWPISMAIITTIMATNIIMVTTVQKHRITMTISKQRTHSHANRGLPEIIEIISQAAITDHAKALAIRIFSIIADAEAKAHGVLVDQVHFHEVGAVDSIVDIVAVGGFVWIILISGR